MTDATAAGRFPVDEPLTAAGRRRAAELEVGRFELALAAPERRAVQTAQVLGLSPAVEPRLADLDAGRWRGLALERVPPGDLAVWLTDPGGAPHGGESVLDVIERVRCWLDAVAGEGARVVAVTHPAVVRAAVLVALDAPPASFWRIDVAPATRTLLHRRARGWTLRFTG
ncbi:histidine phosphatase family protein [Mycobacterium sp. MYCO198283]|nr:histidine phosphatase family protein [Mycobacterium sp. MYCO198283]